jgi:hypothetical protein
MTLAGSNTGTPQVVKAGQTATYYVDVFYLGGTAATPINLSVLGTPSNSTPVFNPQPSFGSGTLTIGTDAATTPAGVYTLSLFGTNSSGLTHGNDTSLLAGTGPPSQPVQRVSVGSGGVQPTALSSVALGATTADGRYVVFSTTASNMSIGNNGNSEVFLRDLQA